MDKARQWLDDLAQRFGEWLDNIFPGHHGLAVVGDRLAGLAGFPLLPVDRRISPNKLMAYDTTFDYSSRPQGNNNDRTCGFWAYCHISGQPCVRCGGRNFLPKNASFDPDFVKLGKQLCPSTKRSAGAWYGCCVDPDGDLRYIGFMDCCGGPQTCAASQDWCEAWPEAKNWCMSSIQPNGDWTYYCTVVIDFQTTDLCNG